jgi:hypothetical protein
MTAASLRATVILYPAVAVLVVASTTAVLVSSALPRNIGLRSKSVSCVKTCWHRRQPCLLQRSFATRISEDSSAMSAGSSSNQPSGDRSAAKTACNASTTAAPLYITIGPPCSGKTTWIKQQKDAIIDITLDDQTGVYHAVPTHWFLDASADQESESLIATENSHLSLHEKGIDTMVHGKSLRDRIWAPDQSELRALLARLGNRISKAEYEAALMTSTRNPAVRQALVEVTEEVLVQLPVPNSLDTNSTNDVPLTIQLPPTVDVYVRETLFRSNREDNLTAIERAERLLWDTAQGVLPSEMPAASDTERTQGASQPMSWGNTNTQPSDYKTALTVAARSRRPVYFVVYRDPEMSVMPPSSKGVGLKDSTRSPIGDVNGGGMSDGENDSIFDLRSSGFVELLRRSLHRLLHTGRYVPATVVWDMRSRTESVIQCGIREALNQPHRWGDQGPQREKIEQAPLSKLEFHQGLSRLINFDMDASRIVTPTNASAARGGRDASGSFSGASTSSDVRIQRPSAGRTSDMMSDYSRKRPWDR